MSRLVEFFYPLPARRRSAGAVFLWWEERRAAYNLIVGGVGCATIVATTLLLALPANAGGSPPFPVLLGVAVVYGVLANFCYFLGPLTELAMYRLWGDEAPRAGPALFRQGLIFSVGLTLFPIALIGLATVARLLARLLGA
jgi:hypothetical protein